MNIFLMIVLIIIALATIRGFRKGIIGLLFGIVSWIFTIVFVVMANPGINSFLTNQTPVKTHIETAVGEYVSDKLAGVDNLEDLNLNKEQEVIIPPELTKSLQTIVKHSQLQPIPVIDDAVNSVQKQVKQIKQDLTKDITATVTDYTMKGLSILLALLIARIICFIIAMILKTIEMNDIIRGVGRLVGTVFGLAEGFFYVWILMYFVTIFAASSWAQAALLSIENNAFLNFLYQNNLITTIISIL